MVHASRSQRIQSMWEGRAGTWSDTVDASAAFARVRDCIVQLAAPGTLDRCLDLGAGTGFLTIPLAERTASVLAVDLSARMLATLHAEAERSGWAARITSRAADATELEFPAGSFDLVVSNYAMHYLADADKKALLRATRRWLAPQGRIVIGDMMIGRKLDGYHRNVLWHKSLRMLRRGPSGWWRLAKNVFRLGSGRGPLRPCPPAWWLSALAEAGFTGATYRHVVSEAGVVIGHQPAAGDHVG